MDCEGIPGQTPIKQYEFWYSARQGVLYSQYGRTESTNHQLSFNKKAPNRYQPEEGLA
jgi:hypothetical protein